MWFIGVEVEQERSVPPPKKNPGSAPGLIETADFIQGSGVNGGSVALFPTVFKVIIIHYDTQVLIIRRKCFNHNIFMYFKKIAGN